MKKAALIIYFFVLRIYEILTQPKHIARPDGKTISIKAIDSIVDKLMNAAEITGLQLGIINNNRTSYIQSYGYKNKAKNKLNNTNTCFFAASLSKPLFAYIVLQLVDEGKIDLDEPLYTYFSKPLPECNNYEDLEGDERWKLLTARICLNHTTGFPNWREYNPHDNKKLEIFFTPGTRYTYSGEGIYLLQLAIETVTGRGLEDLAQEKIFRPFGMTRTSYIWQPRFETDYAYGHDMNGDPMPKDKMETANAAGSMETTIADYTRFMTCAMQGRGLSSNLFKEMFSQQIAIVSKQQFPSLDTSTTTENKKIQLSYGLGWGLFASPYSKAFFKEGHGEGWVNYVISFPSKKIALIILCNDAGGESIFKELVEEITGVTIPWYWECYIPYRATVKLPTSVLESFTGVYDGKLKATVTLVNGRLKVESQTVNLPLTNLYSTNDHQFFLKIRDTDIDFVKDSDGRVVKAVLTDEGDHYELMKIQ